MLLPVERNYLDRKKAASTNIFIIYLFLWIESPKIQILFLL